MSILAECSYCHRKQSIRNKVCGCGADLDKLKGQKEKVKYWIQYYLGDKQCRESIGFSIEEAKDAEGKRRSQKREKRIFDILPGTDLTFKELADWYLELPDVQSLKSYRRTKSALAQFNNSFGESFVCDIKKEDLQRYQKAREGQGAAPATIDMEISIAQTMANNAFDNDKVDGRALKAFRAVKRKLKTGTNARARIFTIGEYLRLLDKAQPHLKPILITAFNTGMRRGELLGLRWSHIDADKGFIRLSEDMTKEHRAKNIPINHNVREVLSKIPRPIHHDYIFTYQGKPISLESGIKKSFKKACKDAGVPYGLRTQEGVIFHDSRRTVKTNMLQAGVEKEYRDTILGHSLKGMDRHYIKPTEETLIQALEKYTQWFDNQILVEIGNSDQTSDQTKKRAN